MNIILIQLITFTMMVAMSIKAWAMTTDN